MTLVDAAVGYAVIAAETTLGRARRWLKWKLLCLRWRLRPGWHDPSRIRWPQELIRER